MASFEERSISSKVDSSDAETTDCGKEKLQFSRINAINTEFNVHNSSELMMSDRLSTMENVIVQNRVQLQSSTSTDTHSDTSSGQTDCNSNSNHGNFEAENIVSSTQETTNDSFNVKLNSDSDMNNIVNNCDVIDVKSTSTLPKSMVNEKHINNEQSHVPSTASASSSQNRKLMDGETKRHLHISTESSKIKSKSSENGLC